ncbi:hypothetical protein MRS44_013624 [Fusarium solani]|uniref:uncharacterized protein n=1 Tax=Fusarium solani TaxID=169388 RepID=UPI0032C49150|nr:hypothetical protein MRS44_013624 [Fusarium solani]
MTPPSPENTDFVNAIKSELLIPYLIEKQEAEPVLIVVCLDVAAIAFEEESGFSIEYTDDNDDGNNDNEVIPKKIVVSLQSSGSSELLRVEAENKLGGLLDLTVKICDAAIKRGLRSSPSEKDIYGNSCTVSPSTFESLRRSTLSPSFLPSTPALPEHPAIVYHIKQTMADPGFDGVERHSPPLTAVRPKIEPSSSPPPDIPPRTHISSTTNNHEDDGTQNTCGDATLIESLTGGNTEMIQSAVKNGLPPDQGDKDLMKDVTLHGNQAPENPTRKRIYRTAFGALEQGNGQTLPPAQRRVAGDGHPNGGLLTNSSKGFPEVFYTDDTSP